MSNKSKIKTLNNSYSRKMVHYAASSNFHNLAMIYHNYKDQFTPVSLYRTLQIVMEIIDYVSLAKEYPKLSLEVRTILNDMYADMYEEYPVLSFEMKKYIVYTRSDELPNQ